MNEKIDHVEVELAGLKPLELSPTTRAIIARRLTAEPASLRVGIRRASYLGCAAVALAIIGIVPQFSGHRSANVPRSNLTPVAVDDAPIPEPTFRAYQEALADSEDRFIALLASRTQTVTVADQPPMHALASTLSEDSWIQLLGGH